jgi:peptide/nickel transport system permease protein
MTKGQRVFFGVVLAVLIASVFARTLAPFDPNMIDQKYWLGDPVPPCFVNAALCGGHLLGSDEVGRDMLSRLMVGAQATLETSLIAVVGMLSLAYFLGVMQRRGGRTVSYLIARASDGLSSLPRWPMLVLIAMVFIGGRHGLPPLDYLAVFAALLLWPQTARLVAAHRPAGTILQRAVKDWAAAILLFATVDFFGWGWQPPQASWGNMLAGMQSTMSTGWWVSVFPAASIFIVVLALQIAARTVFAEERG